MSLNPGNVAIQADGTPDPASAGPALTLYNFILATESADPDYPNRNVIDPDFDGTLAEWQAEVDVAVLALKKGFAKQATYQVQLLPIIVANAVATIQPTDVGLQKTTTAGNPTNAPAANVVLSAGWLT